MVGFILRVAKDTNVQFIKSRIHLIFFFLKEVEIQMLCHFTELKQNTKTPKNKNNHRNRHLVHRVFGLIKLGPSLKPSPEFRSFHVTRLLILDIMMSFYYVLITWCLRILVSMLQYIIWYYKYFKNEGLILNKCKRIFNFHFFNI